MSWKGIQSSTRIPVQNRYHSSFTNDMLHTNIPLLVTGFLRLECKLYLIRDIIILCMSFLNYICSQWMIGECVETNTCSWSHIGRDLRTGKIVILKFIRNDMINHSMNTDQMLQMLQILKAINHQNVVKLYTYQLDVKYPINNIDSSLLILEHVNGGYLFDIVPIISQSYCKQKENVIRTLFKQILDATEAIINVNNNHIEPFHSGFAPYNFLLDTEYTIKISYDLSTEIMLSINTNNESDQRKKNPIRRKKSWKAPETFLQNFKKCDAKALIFSCGIMFFFLITGYAPFDSAERADRKYRHFIKLKKNVNKFWRYHLSGTQDWEQWNTLEMMKDLLNKIFVFDPKERININDIRKHKWLQCDHQLLDKQKLINEIYCGFKQREQKRGKMVLKVNRKYPPLFEGKMFPPDIGRIFNGKPFPSDYKEGMFGEFYTYFMQKGYVAACINHLYGWVGVSILQEREYTHYKKPACFYDAEREFLCCEVLTKNGNKMTFNVEIFESREWRDRYKECDSADNIRKDEQHKIFVVRIKRTSGDILDFYWFQHFTIKMGFWDRAIRGLPEWTLQLQ